MFDFNNKIVVVTGGARGIGACIAQQFSAFGATVCVIDVLQNDYFVGDIADKATLERFSKKVIDDYGHVDYLINNAAPISCGITSGSYEDFEYAQRVGVIAPFYLSKLFAPYLAPGASIVNISSSRDRMSQPQTEGYTAAKGGIAALTHAMAVSLSGRARVNSVSPGWIDNYNSDYAGADAIQQPVGRVGEPLDIANMVLYLCSDMAGFITGENICIDGGMTRQMIYHGENGWTLDKKADICEK
ncbi:MAG: SDR family oxidoreductase [Clostridia bacterium]|nr:SDR family oxidoreductase [Clostridia bacterium]